MGDQDDLGENFERLANQIVELSNSVRQLDERQRHQASILDKGLLASPKRGDGLGLEIQQQFQDQIEELAKQVQILDEQQRQQASVQGLSAEIPQQLSEQLCELRNEVRLRSPTKSDGITGEFQQQVNDQLTELRGALKRLDDTEGQLVTQVEGILGRLDNSAALDGKLSEEVEELRSGALHLDEQQRHQASMLRGLEASMLQQLEVLRSEPNGTRSVEASAGVDASLATQTFHLERTVRELQEKYEELSLANQTQLDLQLRDRSVASAECSAQQSNQVEELARKFSAHQEMYLRDREMGIGDRREHGESPTAAVEHLTQALDSEVSRRCLLISEIHQKMGKEVAAIMRQMEIRLLEVDDRIAASDKTRPRAHDTALGGSVLHGKADHYNNLIVQENTTSREQESQGLFAQLFGSGSGAKQVAVAH